MNSLILENEAGWVIPKQPRLPFAQRQESPSSIATVTTPRVHPAWEDCMNSLLDELIAASTGERDSTQPSYESVFAALRWLGYLKRETPDAAPTFIAPDPDGGILIERRVVAGSDTYIWELMVLNDGRTIMTLFLNGDVFDSHETARSPV